MRGVTRIAASAGLALLLAAVPEGAVAQAPATVQHVTLIGDSVADAIPGDSAAVSILSQGIQLDLEVAPCRRVDQSSCPYNGVRPPNVVELVHTMGSALGPNVVVAVGYNDFADQYAQNIENALAAMRAAGVKHVWWLTLRAAQHDYLPMNDDIRAAAQHHPELSVIDWNLYSRSHPDWFQADGLHLLAAGAEAMAMLIHKTLVTDGVAPPPVAIRTRTLPAAHRLRLYASALAATGGLAPLRWSLLASPPVGLHVLASGAIRGTPRGHAGRYLLRVRVRDGAGQTDTRTVALRVLP